jgi:hypothetical protein
MDDYYVFGVRPQVTLVGEVAAIPYPGFGVLINIVFKEDIAYCVTIGEFYTAMHMPWVYKNVHSIFGKKREMGVLQTSLLCV